MARTFFLTLLACAFMAGPANAGEFISQTKNLDWPPTTDFQLKSDPCAQSQCKFVAQITFRYRGAVVGRIPLHSPARAGGDWDSKRFGHVETTNYAQFFWTCDSPGNYSWRAKISKTQGGSRTDYAAEGGKWKQPNCGVAKPLRISRAKAAATAREKVIFGDRNAERIRCTRKKRVGRWLCVVRWSNEARTCTDRQSLYFFRRRFFHRTFDRVGSFRDSRSCSPS
jgi:hypothetical protein